MDNKNEKAKIDYQKGEDGMLYPNWKATDTGEPTCKLGKYGQLAKVHLETIEPNETFKLKNSHQLYALLKQIDKEATKLKTLLQETLKKKHPATQSFDFWKNIKYYTWLYDITEDIVLKNIVYRPHLAQMTLQEATV